MKEEVDKRQGGEDEGKENKNEEEEEDAPSYDRSRSFFDTISCEVFNRSDRLVIRYVLLFAYVTLSIILIFFFFHFDAFVNTLISYFPGSVTRGETKSALTWRRLA